MPEVYKCGDCGDCVHENGLIKCTNCEGLVCEHCYDHLNKICIECSEEE